MNKCIKPWFIAVTATESVAVLFEVLVFFLHGGFGREQAFSDMCLLSVMLCAGVWLPLLAYFVGICLETKLKRLVIKPVAIGLPFAFSLFGIVWIETHPRPGFMAGFQDIPRYGFYLICGVLSFFLLIAAIVDVVEKKTKKYAEFLAMPNTLFEGRSALLLIPLTVLTVLCMIPAVIGFFRL